MAKADFKSVDEYIASQAEAAQDQLRRVRGAILQALPRAEETISHKIPAYKLGGSVVIYFAGWKKHYSLYPAGGRLVAAFEKELAPYEIKNSTLRFPHSEPVPVKLIGRIAKFRAKEEAERKKTKTVAPKKR